MAKFPSRKTTSSRPSREGSGKSTLKAALEKHKASVEQKKKRPGAAKKKAATGPPKDPFEKFKKPKKAPRERKSGKESETPEPRFSKPRNEAPRKETRPPDEGKRIRGEAPRTAASRKETTPPIGGKGVKRESLPPTVGKGAKREAPRAEEPPRRIRGEAPRGASFRKDSVPRTESDRPKRESHDTERVASGSEATEATRLNKFLSHAGIASRRAADNLILQGHVTVNGVVKQEMGYKVQPTDVVAYRGKTIKPVDKLVYYLLNKPRNVMSTASDERGRKTVLDILARKVKERVYPIGRLDRNTSGLILLTNDGELTKKLSHPSHKVPKVYHATLDRPLAQKDMDAIRNGVKLEDGEAKADSLHFMEDMTKRDVQIELHSGKNRIVRRMFEHLGYEVVKLDRTYYAGLTKKNLPRGFFRHLTVEEIRMLKHFT
jgi:23S rRNA pseudouridine2605 synthase